MNDFSNTDRDVFVIKLERMIDRGALMSRYSRTANLDLRSVYDKEFASSPERGRDFYKRVFTEYGDESIAELVTAQIGIQNISNIATKIIEEARIGLSYLEKSSRYVNYDVKRAGEYLYLHGAGIGLDGKTAEEYDQYCDSLFEGYASIRKGLEVYLKEKYPYESVIAEDLFKEKGTDEDILKKTYSRSVRSRAFDEVRNLLPSSTLTNLGISGNGRAFLSMIQRLRKSDLPETRSLAEAVFSELSEELPELIDNANTDYSMKLVDYERKRDSTGTMEEYYRPEYLVRLISSENEDEAIIGISEAHEYLDGGYYGSNNSVKEMSEDLLKDIKLRENRRHKPGRWFEFTNYTFEIATNFGSFRDLQRHRMMSIVRKRISPVFGFDIPPSISEVPALKAEYEGLMEEGHRLWNKIRREKNEQIAQYCVPFGYTYPVLVHANLRELCYFTELRSTPQAHYDLRHISQQIYREVKDVHPTLSEIFKFVDMNEYVFGRLKSEIRKEKKLRDLDSAGNN